MKSFLRHIFILFFTLKTTTTLAQNTVEKLTISLTEKLNNDSLKVVAIYNWITDNVSYDRYFRKRLEGDTTLYQEPNNVVIRKKAVCIGYAKLLKEMCRLCHIESHIVDGITKSNGSFLDNDEHAWNVVKINDNWCFLDATWGAGDDFSRKKYLFSTPSVFLETHLPHDPMWQLSNDIMPFKCFTENSDCRNISPKYFTFKDSIAHWQSLDSLEKCSNTALRTLRFNEKNIHAIRQMGEYHFKKAFETFTKYSTIKDEVKKHKQKPTNQQTVLGILEAVEKQLNEAENYYEKLKKFAKKNRYTDAHINIDLIQQNRESLEIERAYVRQYFKPIP
jgi:transglutaminase/protease-like cytokinesis protein 3